MATRKFEDDWLERFFSLPEQSDGSHITRVQDEMLVYKAGRSLLLPAETLVYKASDEYLAGMIPAGMNRKARIEALERAASDPTKSAEDRHKAWDNAGKLKAQEKAAKHLAEGNKD